MRKKNFILFFYLGLTLVSAAALPLGDANGDAAISIVDALVVAQYYVGLNNIPLIMENSDVNADGNYDIIDALLIAQYSVGLINYFPAAGALTASSGCKTAGTGTLALDPAEVDSTEECLQYQYDPDTQILYLRHINARINCCGEPQLEGLEISDGFIRLTVGEGPNAVCDCDCLFDIDFEIPGLPPGVYTISINKFYNLEERKPYEITVDLITQPAGIFCVTRDTYPWI